MTKIKTSWALVSVGWGQSALAHSCGWISLGIAAVFCLSYAPAIQAQELSVTIRVLPQAPARVLIEGNCPPTKVWSFQDIYAGVMNLGTRVSGMQLFDATGVEIQTRQIAPGQYTAAQPASRFRYEMNLDPPARASDTAFVSWLSADRGVLTLADLLPTANSSAEKRADSTPVSVKANRDVVSRQATVRLSLPEGWAAYSNESQSGQNDFRVPNVDRAVFAVGKHLRVSRTTVSKTALSIVTDGEWAFTDTDAVEMAATVLKSHQDVFGARPADHVTLILFPFPQTAAADRWSAETRGSTVNLLMGKLPSKTAALAQLSVPMTHELFHPWVP
ncbi:MAG: hypothetical protein ACMG6H_10945, partial [Acidobacteriota bacterium]